MERPYKGLRTSLYNSWRCLLFHAGDTRSRAEPEELLGQSFSGTLSSDDFSLYNGYQVAAQQKCLAHLRRHFQQVTQ